MRISNILKFLFPEYQIIQTISKHGFIASSAAPIPKPQPGDTRQVSSEDYSIRMQDSTAVLVNTKPHANDRQPIEIPAYSPAQAQSATPLNPADVYSKILSTPIL